MNIIKSGLLSVIIITTLFLAACTQEKSTTSTEDSVPSDAQIPAQDENGTSQNAQPSEVAGLSETDNGESSSAEPATTAEPTASAESAAPAEPTESTEDAAKQSFAGNVPAPAFPTGLDWINTDSPLALTDLRGKVVLLDFWTYGCINCLHIIPELKALEEKYADELVVIGVHSAKFENEGDTENIENIVQRYELKHPVVNDNQYQIWSLYGARAWPTLVLIDPVGNVLGYHAGEDIYDRFDFIIGSMIEEFDQRGLVNRTPLSFNTSQERVESPLLFPGKVLADVEGDRLFISDSNHNRIVVTDFEGNVMEVIGDGQARLQDGDFETASFFRPQGLTLKDQNTLYVADTENHAIRAVNLADRTVETAAGNGEQSYISVNSAKAESLPLNSPWDVLYYDGILYIAMAGQHQIWAFDPESGEIAVYAGSGYEELTDGALLEGGLNQPSGLSTDGLLLYVADSESSSIRTADLDPAGDLATIVGTGLFEFGDIDGTGNEVRLQHPLGVAYDDGKLYVADTYNSKIKIVDPESRESISYLGGSESGWRDGS
ncbi:MAG: thioredoxin-like domain-containing protein, partial [Candidatus Promineifilaceae bacterium]